jgi:hypothetical protein
MYEARGADDSWLTGSVADVLGEAYARENWRKVRAMCEQSSRLIREGAGRDLMTEVLAELANAFSVMTLSYRLREEQLACHALAVFSNVAGREAFDLNSFRAAYRDDQFRDFGADSSVACLKWFCGVGAG